MTVGQRLYLMVIPGILGVGLAVALAYWGEYDRQAPLGFVVIAVTVAVVSAAVAWYNARYLSRRLDQLAHARRSTEFERLLSPITGALGPDELDTIEGFVARLGERVQQLTREAEDARAVATDERRALAALLAEAARSARGAVDEARLPLHILAEAPFGELNDNQLELLADARAAAERGDRALARLEDAGALLAGRAAPRAERVSLTELLRGIEPQLKAAAVRAGATLLLDIEPALPRVLGDRERLREALLALILDALASSAGSAPVAVAAHVVGGRPALDLSPAAPPRALDAKTALLELAPLGVTTLRDGATLRLTLGDVA